MEYQTNLMIIVSVCAGLLLLAALRRKAEWLLNFVLRGVFGTISILLANFCILQAGITGGIGLNPLTVLTAAILGFPGVLMLYGIFFYSLL